MDREKQILNPSGFALLRPMTGSPLRACPSHQRKGGDRVRAVIHSTGTHIIETAWFTVPSAADWRLSRYTAIRCSLIANINFKSLNGCIPRSLRRDTTPRSILPMLLPGSRPDSGACEFRRRRESSRAALWSITTSTSKTARWA